MEHENQISLLMEEHVSTSDVGSPSITTDMESTGTEVQVTNSEDSLLSMVRNKKLNVKNISSELIEFYTQNPEAALIKIMQFVIEASGSRYKIPEATKFPICYNQIIEEAIFQFHDASKYYPLITRNASIFARDVTCFVQNLLKTADGTSIVFDNFFLKNFTGFVMVCSEAKVRAIRHTSTLIGVKMLTILNDLSAVEYNQLEAVWMEMFRRIFMERSRDVVDDIRLICLSECAIWLNKYPHCFLKDNHIKCIFAFLHDKAPKLRECSLKTLLNLFSNVALQPVCKEFGKEYVQCIYNLAVDSESELGELAVKLISELYKVSPESISDNMENVILELIFSAHRGLAQAAAQFANFLNASKEGDNQVRQLVQFFIKFDKHEHAAYFVDAHIESNTAVVDWPCMVEMLLKQPVAGTHTLTNMETSAVIEIMNCGVKQAITGDIPAGRYNKDLARSASPTAENLATQCFASSLATLIRLNRHNERRQDVINLIELPQYLNLYDYFSNRWRCQCEELLDQLNEIMFEECDDAVLSMCAKTFECIFKAQTMMQVDLETRRKQLLTNAVTNYKIAENFWRNSMHAICSSSNQQVRAERLLKTLKLLAALYAYFDLREWLQSSALIKSLELATKLNDNQTLTEAAIHLYLEVCYFALSWELRNVLNETTAADTDLEEECADLRENLEKFLFTAFGLIQEEKNVTIGHKAFECICDLFVLFADQLRCNANTNVRLLEYKSSINEHELLESFLLQNIFCVAPERLMDAKFFSELQSKRRILVSYCKLVAFNILPIMRACVIFQYYDQYYEVYGDIMRVALERGLSINPINYGMTLIHTCILAYNRIKNEKSSTLEMSDSAEFASLLRLAKRLAETFETLKIAGRAGAVTLHRAGIMFAAELVPEDPTRAPENLLFLSVIREFSPQLLAQDKLNILNSLEIEQPALPSCSAAEWQPLESYRSSLKYKKNR